MKNFLKAIPLPISAVILGLAALGNLLQSYSEVIRLTLGCIAAIIWLFLIIKCIIFRREFIQCMQDPVTASVTGSTFTMSTMLLASYALPFIVFLARIVWFAGLILNIIFIIWFTLKFAVKRDLSKIFASYFVVYVGIVISSLTSPAFGMAQTVGVSAFWFGFICLIVLLIVVTRRYVKLPVKADPPRPLFCIYAAPTSLCLAGYIQVIDPKSPYFIFFLLGLSTIIYIIVLIRLPGFLKLPFYPSYAAFTFPFVITAIAAKQSMACLTNLGYQVSWLSPIVLIETVIAVILVCYTFIRYLMAIFKAAQV